MLRFSLLAAPVMMLATPLFAAEAPPTTPVAARLADGDNPLIDYDSFAELTTSLAPVRRSQLLRIGAFRAMADERGTLLLDARSAKAFAAGHMAGAINLPLPDFTEASLAAVIGANKGRPILIYCNNNFTDNRWPVATKKVELALNIQTFVNLHGYGYTNVWELGEAVSSDEPQVRWKSRRAKPAATR